MSSAASAWAADPPAEKVLAMYFHRTQRCPTCLKMGTYAEEAVAKGFEKQVKAGTVEFVYVDFQIAKNAKLTKAYKSNVEWCARMLTGWIFILLGTWFVLTQVFEIPLRIG